MSSFYVSVGDHVSFTKMVKAAIDGTTRADNGRYIDTAGSDMPW